MPPRSMLRARPMPPGQRLSRAGGTARQQSFTLARGACSNLPGSMNDQGPMALFKRNHWSLASDRRSVLLVGSTNVCRSPMAEAALRKRLWRAGLDFDVDSAATHADMAGMHPFTPAVVIAKRRGYNIAGIVARGVRPHDFRDFDLILGMCRADIEWLHASCPGNSRRRVKLLTEYSARFRYQDVPDPYGGSVGGYELALDIIEDACDGVARSYSASLRPGHQHVAELRST
jgi:protein-tyrosine phosphatase